MEKELREEFIKAFEAELGSEVKDSGACAPAAGDDKWKTITLAVGNQKGGCGKTTTAINLSACLAEMGYSVLLIDMDPQAHATLGLGFQGDAMDLTLYHLLMRPELRLLQVALPTYHRNLKIIPSNGLLAAAQVELLHVPGREQLLKNKIQELNGYFQFILIDCPPSLNILTLNALTAAEKMIVPIQTQYYSLDGMRELFKTIDRIRQSFNPKLEILGILPTLVDPSTRLNRAMLKALQEYFKEQIFKISILLHPALAECPILGQPVIRYAPECQGARDYRQLAEEVVARAAITHRFSESSTQAL